MNEYERKVIDFLEKEATVKPENGGDGALLLPPCPRYFNRLLEEPLDFPFTNRDQKDRDALAAIEKILKEIDEALEKEEVTVSLRAVHGPNTT